jgi:hypothetical protein
VTAAANKVESFDWFSQWPGFGNRGVIADNDPVEQEKAMKLNALLTNAVFSELPRRGFRSPLQGRRRCKVLPRGTRAAHSGTYGRIEFDAEGCDGLCPQRRPLLHRARP